MTGEITLSGRVLPVSGIREKLLAAQRARMKVAMLPAGNKEDYDALPRDVSEGLEVIFVGEGDEVVATAFVPE